MRGECHSAGQGADDDGDAESIHQAHLLGGNGVDFVDDLNLFFGDEPADDFLLHALVVNVAEDDEGLGVDFWGDEFAAAPDEAAGEGVGGEVESVVILWKSGEDFGFGAFVGDEVGIDAALAEEFEAKPWKGGLAAEFIRDVLPDDADFERSRIHPIGT